MIPSLIWAAALPLPLAAQLGVVGVRPLSFGTVFPGIAAVVVRTDPANSGQFAVHGEPNGPTSLTFSLPAAMTGPGGATLPLVFGANDGGFSVTQSVTNQVAFDPRVTQTVTLSQNGRGSVFLGGTANPAVSQAAGNYTGTVTLSVVLF
jgi:hypothetical protein